MNTELLEALNVLKKKNLSARIPCLKQLNSL